MSFLKLAFDDILMYHKVRKAIRKHKRTPEWRHLGLRVDWIGRIWKVINLPKEYEGDDIRIRDSLAVDISTRYGNYLRDVVKIGDWVYQAAEPKTKRSYLFVWSPMFEYWTIWKLIKWIVFIFAITAVATPLYAVTLKFLTLYGII